MATTRQRLDAERPGRGTILYLSGGTGRWFEWDSPATWVVLAIMECIKVLFPSKRILQMRNAMHGFRTVYTVLY